MIQPKHVGWSLFGLIASAFLITAGIKHGWDVYLDLGLVALLDLGVLYAMGLTIENEWCPWRWVIFD